MDNKVLTMSWLIFLALLLPAPQDPQIPPIGIIDLYGLRSISERQVRELLQIKEGDSLSGPPKEAERKLESLPGVQASFVLLGRVVGLPEDEITAAWERGDRATFIVVAVKRANAK